MSCRKVSDIWKQNLMGRSFLPTCQQIIKKTKKSLNLNSCSCTDSCFSFCLFQSIVTQFHLKIKGSFFGLTMVSPLTDLPCCMPFSCREEVDLSSSLEDQHQKSALEDPCVRQTLDMHMNEIAALTEKNRWLVKKPNPTFFTFLSPTSHLSLLLLTLLSDIYQNFLTFFPCKQHWTSCFYSFIHFLISKVFIFFFFFFFFFKCLLLATLFLKRI